MSKRARKQFDQLTRHHGGGGADSITGFMGNKHRRLMPEDVGTAETPYEMLPVPEGTETADTGTWDRDNQPEGYDGVSIRLSTRDGYWDAGDEVFYGFYRLFTWNSIGLLVTISAETRYIIDTPEECP